jgi:chloramphenicol 3-O phosphotransferase
MNSGVVVLNGGSSSGKTSIARCLQELLPGLWLRLGIDDLVAALPGGQQAERGLITFAPDGGVAVGPGFRRLEAAWSAGLAAMARAGAGVIYDDVFLQGASSQARLRLALEGLEVLWVGVRCDPAVAMARESARQDRVAGMAASQADVVHLGVDYDLVVDTTSASAMACAQLVQARITEAGAPAPTVPQC